jgi:hypothetical protein
MNAELKYGNFHTLEKAADPPVLTRVETYCGQKAITLACTQTQLGARKQAKIVEGWCDLFRNGQPPIEKLWVGTRISQEIVAAISCLDRLDTLYIKWGVYTDISGFANLAHLEHLRLGGGASLKSIDAVFALKRLKTFASDRLYEIHDYSRLGELQNLEDLAILGDGLASMKKVRIDSLQFLESLPRLFRLLLIMVRVGDGTYPPSPNCPG